MEDVRQGYNPDRPDAPDEEQMHNTDGPFKIGEDDDEEEEPRDELGQKQPWEHRDYDESTSQQPTPEYGSFNEERNAWGDGGK